MFADELKEEQIGIGSMELIEVLLGEDNPGLVVNVDVEGVDGCGGELYVGGKRG